MHYFSGLLQSAAKNNTIRAKRAWIVIALAALSAPAAIATTAHFSAVQIQVASCTCYGVAVDSSGNVYIADTNNNKVWKETLSNGAYTKSLVAGSFNKPYGVAVDTSGNVYVADTGNNRVIKETLSSGSYSSSGVILGLPTSPYNVAVDAGGNVYVAGGNSGAPYVYKLTPSCSSYTKTVIAGASSGMQTPWEVAVDSTGNVFVTDSAGNTVYKLTVSGSSFMRSTVATGLDNPTGIAVDTAENVYVSNANQNQIVLETPSGSSYTQSVFATGPLNLPYELAVDTNKSLYIANPQIGNILREDRAGNFGSVNVDATSQPLDIIFAFDSSGTINAPSALTRGAANLDFADTGTGTCTTNGTSYSYAAGDTCIVSADFSPKYAGSRYGAVVLNNSAGNPIATAYIYGVGVAAQAAFFIPATFSSLSGFSQPAGVAVDGSGNLYVADGPTVYEMAPGCASTACAKTLGGGFHQTWDVAVDGAGNVYVADGAVEEMPAGCASSACVTNRSANIYADVVTIDGGGNIYFAGDNGVLEIPVGCTVIPYASNPCVRTLPNNGHGAGPITTDAGGNVYFIGFPGVQEIPVGCDSASCLVVLGGGWTNLYGIAVDASGNIYVTDGTLKEMPPGCPSTGCVKTLGGVGYKPGKIALDSTGNIYVVDDYDKTINVINRATPPSFTFAYTAVGSKSSDSPKTVTVQNIGNATLNFPLPSAGKNPSISPNFVWDSSSTCRQTLPSTSVPFSLAQGASCTIAVDFEPTTGGSASGGGIGGSVILSDNTLNATAPNYATQTVSLSGSSTPIAGLTSPTPSSTLAGPAVTFKWSAATGATGYLLRLGSTGPGSYNVYGSGTVTTTSVSPTNLPTNGSTVYARLFSDYGSASAYTDYTFTAATAAALTSPAPNSTLPGPAVTFHWTAPSGATGYTLRLGTTGPGSDNMYSSGTVTTTSASPTSLPANGGTIYARLYTRYGSVVAYTDYQYTAATAAVLTSPAPNSTLAGSTVTFNWTAASGATGYTLRLGTTQGGYDIYGSGVITATSATPTHIPTNGETIYARLYTRYGSALAYTDYVYKAAP